MDALDSNGSNGAMTEPNTATMSITVNIKNAISVTGFDFRMYVTCFHVESGGVSDDGPDATSDIVESDARVDHRIE